MYLNGGGYTLLPWPGPNSLFLPPDRTNTEWRQRRVICDDIDDMSSGPLL
jgi:hypothetical protein